MSEHREIPLSRGMVALVDAEDYGRLMAMAPWHASPHGRTTYARKTIWHRGQYLTLRMHSVITGWEYVDHANGDGLDNRWANLRAASHGQNMHNKRLYANNTSGFKGVTRHAGTGSWQARIWVSGRMRSLGLFADPAAAACAYDRAAAEHFGEFARLNFPTGVAA